MQPVREVRVWDIFVRLFHWLLVAAFFTAYLTEGDDLLPVHTWAGYAVLGLVLARVFWGFAGSQHARFVDFLFPPRVIAGYLQDLAAGRPRRYLGHNPAGGAMILLMLLSLVLTTLSGIAVFGADQHAGLMAGLFAGASEELEDVIEEAHELLANFTLLLVIVHVIGVIVESIVHRENLTWAMVTGRKREQA